MTCANAQQTNRTRLRISRAASLCGQPEAVHSCVRLKIMKQEEINSTVTNARRLLKERIDSLMKDVSYCILDNKNHERWPAAFPALLYCFSTIDLLGCLYWKCTLSNKNQQKKCLDEYSNGVTNKSFNYMMDFMHYPELESKLIQKVFRHKIVHLAQPSPSQKYAGKEYSWAYSHNDRSKHLKIFVEPTMQVSIFHISIWSLTEDISDSVFGSTGYLGKLADDTPEGHDLREKFNNAYKEILS